MAILAEKESKINLVYIVNLFIFASWLGKTAQLLIFTLGGILLLATGVIVKLQYK